MKNLLFLCIASAIVIFNVIVINFAPNIKGDLISMSDTPCNYLADRHKYRKEKTVLQLSRYNVLNEDDKKEYLDLLIENKNRCYRHKAMEGLEYSSLCINITFGFICAILGLLQYLNAGNNIGKIVGILGLATGIIGFVLTLVYVIYSGIIFTQEVVGKSYNDLDEIYQGVTFKGESDGSLLEWNDDKKSYECIFYNKDNKDSVFIKYSDYGKNYLNYYKKRTFATEIEDYEINGCAGSFSDIIPFIPIDKTYRNFWDICKMLDDKDFKFNNGNDKMIEYFDTNGKKVDDCKKLRMSHSTNTNENRNIYDHWVTSIVFSCLIIVLEIGLAIFGFLLFKDSTGKGTPL